MTGTSHPDFDHRTEALDVARAFAELIHGKTMIVTGANHRGVGFATLEALASQSPAHLILAGRNMSKVQDCIAALKARFPNVDYRHLVVDLSSQQSVRSAAAEVLSWFDVPTVDVIVNNAAVMLVPERTLSEDGIEMHFATNHIGHFMRFTPGDTSAHPDPPIGVSLGEPAALSSPRPGEPG